MSNFFMPHKNKVLALILLSDYVLLIKFDQYSPAAIVKPYISTLL